MNASALEEHIKAMNDVNNAKAGNITGDDLAPFVHDPIIHLGQSYPRDEWAKMSAQAFAAVPGSSYDIYDITPNEKEQKLSIKASWKTEQGKELLVLDFTYQFEDGKIKETSSSSSLKEITEKFMKAISAATSK
jgi:hypothetical protein